MTRRKTILTALCIVVLLIILFIVIWTWGTTPEVRGRTGIPLTANPCVELRLDSDVYGRRDMALVCTLVNESDIRHGYGMDSFRLEIYEDGAWRYLQPAHPMSAVTGAMVLVEAGTPHEKKIGLKEYGDYLKRGTYRLVAEIYHMEPDAKQETEIIAAEFQVR